LEGSGGSLIEVLFQDLPGGTEGYEIEIEDRGIPRKSSVRIAGVPAGIRTENLPNTRL
jgi:hypothetical protein